MTYLETYLQTIINRGNPELAESISKTAEDVGTQYLKTFSFCSHEIGLLFGNVQSGKTGQMFGIICKATDLGFPVFLVLTTDNIVLQQQTLERVKADLTGYCVCDENDAGQFIHNNLMKPVIIVLKKNYRILRYWANIFATTGFMKGNTLFIIDDEADAASLNTLVNRGQQSAINKYLDSIKMGATSSIYLQVTGTPQSIFLQNIDSGWHPYFTYYFRPGKGYLGGDCFFQKNKISKCIVFLKKEINHERSAVIHHLVVSGQIIVNGGKVCNCLIHPSVRQAVHGKYKKLIEKELLWCKEHIDNEFREQLKNAYNEIQPEKSLKANFEDIFIIIKKLLKNNLIKILVMNSKYNVDSSKYSEGYNIIIGGNTLGRGVTFPSLQTIYYTRISKKPQADTMWQHSRMFGYDRDLGMMRVYIDEKLYKLFSDINATNNSIIAQIEKGHNNIKVYYPKGIIPTREAVLDKKKVFIFLGGTNYYPFNPDNNTIEDLDKLLNSFDEQAQFYQVSLQFIKKVFSYIKSDDDFDIDSFISIIDMMLADNILSQGILIVRRNRNISKGTGAMLSPNDWKLGSSFKNKVVLTLYKITGGKGWDGKKIWIPNIKLPDDTAYYNIKNLK